MSCLDRLRRMRPASREFVLSALVMLGLAVTCVLLLIMSATVAQTLLARYELLLKTSCNVTRVAEVVNCEEDDCKGFYITADMLLETGELETGVKVVPNLRRGRPASESGGGNRFGLERLLGMVTVGEETNCWYEAQDCSPGDCFATLSADVGQDAMVAISVMWALFASICGVSSCGTLLKYCVIDGGR